MKQSRIPRLELALGIARECKNPRAEARALTELGSAYLDDGQTRRALECLEEAVVLAQALDDTRCMAIALDALGSVYCEEGDVPRAIPFHEQAVELFRILEDPKSEARTLCNLGNAYAELPDREQAVACYERGLWITDEIGEVGLEGTMLYNLAGEYAKEGEYAKAVECARDALALLERAKDPMTSIARAAFSLWSGIRTGGFRGVIKGMHADFLVLSGAEARVIVPARPYVVVSITDSDAPDVTLAEATHRLGVLRLKFDDVLTSGDAGVAITGEDGVGIVRFIDEHRGAARVIVCHCEYGVSRSAAVAAALSEHIEGDSTFFFRHFTPNALVYETVRDARSK